MDDPQSATIRTLAAAHRDLRTEADNTASHVRSGEHQLTIAVVSRQPMRQDRASVWATRRAVLTAVGAAVTTGTLFTSGAVAQTSKLRRSETSGPATSRVALRVADAGVRITGKPANAVLLNGSLPGPLLRFREGDDIEIAVTNALREDTSVHWHGLLLPPEMDGVPGISFPGIKPGETFTYRFRLRQSGTYWYHSHSGGQEMQGVFGAMIIDPAAGDRHRAERDYVVILSDWHDEHPLKILANLKRDAGYYNYNKRTVPDIVQEWRNAPDAEARAAVTRELFAWGKMRMDPTDLADVSGYTFLVNGKTPAENWTALFRAGERVRLRFINAAGMTLFDVKVPDLPMTVVQADGQDVRPVTVDEFRIGPGETYDVVVKPPGGRAYTIFAQSLDRSGYARATIAEREGMTAPVPAVDPRPRRKLSDMGGDHAGHGGAPPSTPAAPTGAPSNMPAGGGHQGHGAPATDSRSRPKLPDMGAQPGGAPSNMPPAGGAQGRGAPAPGPHAQHKPPDMGVPRGGHGGAPSAEQPPAHGAPPSSPSNVPAGGRQQDHGMSQTRPVGAPPGAGGAWRKLRYADLRALTPDPNDRPPGREIVLRLTGVMERYLWTINDRKLSAAEPVNLRYGERVRITYVNTTMMEHPMHLHGVFTGLQVGHGAYAPRKHTIIVDPGRSASADFTADEPGTWALHCHLLLHMVAGMFTKVTIGRPGSAPEIRGGR